MTDTKTIKVGLLGLGTVGTGVYKLIGRRSEEMQQKTGAALEIKKILVHNMKKVRQGVDQNLLTDQWKEIAWVEYASTMSRSMSRICEVPDLEYTGHDVRMIKQYILATVEIEEQLTELILEFKND